MIMDDSLKGLNSVDCDCIPLLRPETSEEEIARKIRYYTKLATKHGAGKVCVGALVESWEDYTNSRLYAVIECPVQDDEFTGVKRVECFISLKSPAEVAQMASGYFPGRTLVVDLETKQIIAARPSFF
ncbi:hypothetical protein [Candidatus Clostridium stratigraminis]|uniref:Uncharacterized protein n=1 Tax=Candidatus Clostridium stratigraminis TaxID=3381661 RepID=A0ABW8T0Y7_9CLOT